MAGGYGYSCGYGCAGKGKHGKAGPVRLTVEGLLPECEEEDLQLHFERFGPVAEVKVYREKDTNLSRQCGHVQMQDGRALAALLAEAHKIFNHAFRVIHRPQAAEHVKDFRWGSTEEDAGEAEAEPTETADPYVFYASELAEGTTDDELHDYFVNFGVVGTVALLPPAAASVRMADAEVVEGIITLGGHEVHGAAITVTSVLRQPCGSEVSSNGCNGKGKKGNGWYPYAGGSGKPGPGKGWAAMASYKGGVADGKSGAGGKAAGGPYSGKSGYGGNSGGYGGGKSAGGTPYADMQDFHASADGAGEPSGDWLRAPARSRATYGR